MAEAQWEADHVIPLAEGGEHVAGNLRTLCRPCHVAETRALRKRLALARRGSAGGA
jgi:5-methylcytosine-specific restriction endonuclease McrA